MKRAFWLAGVGLALAIVCTRGAEPATDAPALDPAARQAEWSWLTETKSFLDTKREELAALEEQAAGGAAVADQLEAARRELGVRGGEFDRRIADYINADLPLVDQPPTPEQAAAIRLKSSEDARIAGDQIAYAGAYDKAIAICTEALRLDPDNAEVKAALEAARANQFVTAERFAAIKAGMSQAEVVKLLGRPPAKDVHAYPERKVTAWYYAKNETGEAAGVFFNDKLVVYAADFVAVKKNEAKAPG